MTSRERPAPGALRLRVSLWLIRMACALAPASRRGELLGLWEAELLHRWSRRGGGVGWSLGAFRHAWYLLRTEYTMDLIWQDMKYGVRALNRSRGLIAIAVLSLGIGIGANTAIFSAVDVFMLRPLPYPDGDRLYTVWVTNAERRWSQVTFSLPDFVDLRDESRTMDAAAYQFGSFSLSGDFEAELLEGQYVTPGFFEVLGVMPAVGRGFTAEEGVPGADGVVVISHGLWQRRFGADPDLLGSSILVDGAPHTVVGVMPPRFWFGRPGTDIWAVRAVTGEERRDSHGVAVLARARDGFSQEQLRSEAQGVMERLAQAYPDTNAGHGALVLTLHEVVFDSGFQAGTLISTVGVALVLLIACANVANLLLTNAAGREREVALRGALGAGRSRIVRQFLTEAGIVAALGGLLGLALSVVGIRGLISIMPPEFPRVHEIGLSPRVLGYTAAVTMLTGLLFGLAPALHSTRGSLAGGLTEGGRGGSAARGGRLRKGLVVGEISLALVLLVSSALLVQGFARIRLADLGFDRGDVLTFQTLLPPGSYPDSTARADFYTRLRPRLAALPGVEEVGAVSALPLQGFSSTYYVVDGEDLDDTNARQIAGFKTALPGYFGSLDIPLLRGRAFDGTDRFGSLPVTVVNETLAKRHWPDTDPVGHVIELSGGPVEVVGVVGDTRDAGGDEPARAMLFLPVLQRPGAFMDWAVEATVPLPTLVEAVRAEVSALDPTVPAYDILAMDDLIEQSLGGDLIMARIMSVLAVIALVLALGGVYGVMAYTVTQRTRELGIRMSLGAQRADVLGMVVRQGTLLAVVGIVVGIGLALVATRGLSRFLFGVSPFEPVTFASVSAALFVAGVVATYFPARRATRVDPVVALRAD